MHPCKFPLAPTTLAKKNDNLNIKQTSSGFSFELNGTKFKSEANANDIPCRITLQHKQTGEILTFYDTSTLIFKPDIEKLVPKESGSKIGASFAQLTREYGSVKAQKQLREKEKLQINKEAQKTLKATHRDALKEEKIEAAKGNKLDKTSMDCALDGSFSTATLSNLIDDDRRIKLSNIAPKEILDALHPEAETVMPLSYEQIECLKSSLSFQPSILDIFKKCPTSDIRIMKLRILLEYMMRFLCLPINKIRSKEPLVGCPSSVTKFLILNFTKEVFTDTGKSSIQVNKDEKDKLYLMIIALYGYLCNYQFPINRFMIDIKAGRDRIKKLGLLIDMKIVLVNKEHVMTAAKPYILDDLS